MATFEVKVILIMESDTEEDALMASQSAVENMVCGDILEAVVYSIDGCRV